MPKCIVMDFDCSYRDHDGNCTLEGVCPFLFADDDLTFEGKHEALDEEQWYEELPL